MCGPEYSLSHDEIKCTILALLLTSLVYLILQVRSYTVHEGYLNSSSRDFDVALLKLLHPAKMTPHVGLACLPSDFIDPPVGTLCTVTGWGHLEFNAGWSPKVLHMAEVPIVSHRYVLQCALSLVLCFEENMIPDFVDISCTEFFECS